MHKYISQDQLPAKYEGTRSDDEFLRHVKLGCDVPEKYYLINRTETSREEMMKVVVGRGSSHKECIEVVEVGSTLQWEFFTANYDIAFRIDLKHSVAGKNTKQAIVRRHDA